MPEGFDVGRRGRRHAKTAVVIDLRSAKRYPGELPESVRFFIGKCAAAEDADRVETVLALGRTNSRRDARRVLRPR